MVRTKKALPLLILTLLFLFGVGTLWMLGPSQTDTSLETPRQQSAVPLEIAPELPPVPEENSVENMEFNLGLLEPEGKSVFPMENTSELDPALRKEFAKTDWDGIGDGRGGYVIDFQGGEETSSSRDDASSIHFLAAPSVPSVPTIPTNPTLPSSSQQVETTFAGGNGQYGNYFAVLVDTPSGINVTSMTGNFSSGGTARVWVREGGYGSSPGTSGWTEVATAAISAGGQQSFATDFDLPSGVHTFLFSGSSYLNYSNGTSVGAIAAQDSNLWIFEGYGTADVTPNSSSSWGGYAFSPRVWNGIIAYSVIDDTPPETTITSAPSGYVPSTSATIHFSSSDSNGYFQWQILQSNWVNWSDDSMTFNNNLPQGSVTFQVRAVDIYGNADPTPSTATWIIDTIAPSTPSGPSPSDGAYTSDSTPTFSWSSIPDAVIYVIRIDDNSDFSSPVVHTTSSSNSYTPPTLSDGTYYWSVAAEDLACNSSGYSSTWVFHLDTSVPNTTITSAPSGIVSSTSASISFSSNESGVTFQRKLDSGSWTAATSPLALSSLSQGSHTIQTRAIDAAGNTDASPASASWTVDTIAPGTPSLSAPANGTVTNDTTPTLSWSAISDASFYTIQVDSNASFNSGYGWTTNSSSNSMTFTPIAEGTYYWRVKAVDVAGNHSGYSRSRYFVIDTTAPTNPSLLINGGSTYTATTGVTLSLSAVGASEMRFKNGSNGSWSGYEAYATTKSWTLENTQGMRTVYVQFRDEAGNATSG
ncbi:MAG: Ig-like domain-containing protein, partial [Planctomycetota bacterium]|nr:Ig-like domain-containing protein [Planctomycetota bacterium]